MTRNRNNRTLPHFARWFFAKTALVSGATSGIGREIARQLAYYGCRVLLCGRDEQAMNSLLEELKASSSSAEGFFADFSNAQSLQELITRINKNYDIDILVNNAGFGDMNDFRLMSEDKIYAMQQVNISAVVALCRAYLPRMVEKSTGGILNVGSTASFFATPGSALYGGTKHFILGFTDALHQEMISSGIHVSGVYPDRTKSRFLERATAGRVKGWQKAMDPVAVADLALKGLSENRIRVIPGLLSKIKVFLASRIPVSILLNKTYLNTHKYYKQ